MNGGSGSERVFPFFVGSGRSGTTLFRNVFDSHPQLAVMHEGHFIGAMARLRRRYETRDGFATTTFVNDLYRNDNFLRQGVERAIVTGALVESPPGDLADAVRRVLECFAAVNDKPYYGDKTPGYVAQIAQLSEMFPDAKFVHIIRDGRDVATSYLDRDEWGPSTIGEAAYYWRTRVGRGSEVGGRLGPHRYREVRYEDMVEDPEGTARELCDFLGLDFDPAMMAYHEKGREFAASTKHPDAFAGLSKPVTKGMRDWRSEMAPEDVALFETIAGDLLRRLGYEVTGTGGGIRLRTRAMAAQAAWQARRTGARVTPAVRRLRRKLQPFHTSRGAAHAAEG